MIPILLVHGYSSEGKDSTVEIIYGSLPEHLKRLYGAEFVRDINLSRWVSLNDGIRLDDVSLAMDRALKSDHKDLLESGFHVIIHSTGALVVRNWIKYFCKDHKPAPIRNLIHLAGANFGSGLAHIGQGQLARWGRKIFEGTGRGKHILTELEFGCWKTLDLHLHFLKPGNDMLADYGVQEYVITGSQTLPWLRVVPIRYVKEDSSDSTVRTSAANLNFNYVAIKPTDEADPIRHELLASLIDKRLEDETVREDHYRIEELRFAEERTEVSFAIAYETSHFGEDTGIVTGKKNRDAIMPLIQAALDTPRDPKRYADIAAVYQEATDQTYRKVARLKNNLTNWDRHQQYEGHSQLIFRIRDQHGVGIDHFDITFKSKPNQADMVRLESMIQDTHRNKANPGTMTFYLRTQSFINDQGIWDDLLERVAPLHVEITGHEPQSKDISFVPMNVILKASEVKNLVRSFRTTVIDVTMTRLPSAGVFSIQPAG